MEDKLNLDMFTDLVKAKILAGELPVEIRKYIRHERGLGKTQGNDYYNKIDKSLTKKERAAIPRVEVETVNVEGFQDYGDTAVAEIKGISTLEGLIEAAQVDLEVWEMVKSAVSVYRGNFSVRAEFRKRTQEIESRNLLEIFKEQANQHSPVKFAKSPDHKDVKKLLVFNAADVHFNKEGSREETGYEDYNLEISVRIFNETVDALIQKSKSYGKVGKTLFVIGNDLLNADYLSGTTSINLTPQDNDKSWFKAYTTVCQVMTETVEKFSTLGEVDILVCMGNHSMHSCFSIGEYLQAWFRNNPAIQVLNEPKMRKYYRFEKNAFLLSHGHGEKLADLPLIMATECPFWSECPNREIFSHHVHHQKVIETKGVVTRVFPSLAGVDRYHALKGFVQNRRIGQVLIYNETGLDALFEYQPKLC